VRNRKNLVASSLLCLIYLLFYQIRVNREYYDVCSEGSIIKNDFDSLAEQLKQHNVDDLSIVELQQAIHSDQNCPEIKEQKFGSNVKEWMKTMLSKVVDGIWEIEIATAGNLLSTAIQKYYGW
jgi:hypothetical protein